MKNVIFIIACFSAWQWINAQDYIQLYGRSRDNAFFKSMSIVPIFELEGDTIEENNAFGVEAKIKNQKHKIILPNSLPYTRIGYGYLYSGIATNQFAMGYIPFIVANNTRGFNTTYFFIDRNNDLDFTNDGSPDSVEYTANFVDLAIKNLAFPTQKHIIRLSRFESPQQQSFINLSDSHFFKHSDNKKYMGTYYSFREQRLNVLAGTYKINSDSFTIAINDNNCNGKFNDADIDEIYLAPYQTEDYYTLGFLIQKNAIAYIETKQQVYALSDIANDGSRLYIEPNSELSFKHRLIIQQKLPKTKLFKITPTKISKMSTQKFGKKHQYIYFCNIRSGYYALDPAYLRKISETHKDSISIAIVCMGNLPHDVKRFVSKENLPYPVYLITDEAKALWHIREQPFAIELRKKRIISLNKKPQEILNK